MNDGEALLLAHKDQPNELTPILILADWLEENRLFDTTTWIRNNGITVKKNSNDDGYGDGDGNVYGSGGGGGGDGGGYGGGYGGGGYGNGGGDGGGGFGGGFGDGGGGGGFGDGGYGNGDSGSFNKQVTGEWLMESGFYILVISGGYWPYVIVGWVERWDFLLQVRNSRVIKRFGRNGQLAQLAKDGPLIGDNPTQLLELSEEEWVPLSSVSRVIPADSNKWAMCPEPK